MSEYSMLNEDLEILEEEIEKRRHEMSKLAGRNKKRFLFCQWTVVFAGVILVGLGAAINALGEEGRILVLVQAIISFVAAAMTLLLREADWQKRWLCQRGASEKLKSEYFLFLGRVGEYSQDNRVQVLRSRVASIDEQLFNALTGKE
jgi:cell division protein FtsW (lipid II flippase)